MNLSETTKFTTKLTKIGNSLWVLVPAKECKYNGFDESSVIDVWIKKKSQEE